MIVPVHAWTRSVKVARVAGHRTPLSDAFLEHLLAKFRSRGHEVQEAPDASTDAILTAAPFGRPVEWRDALLFSSLRRLNLARTPTLYTLVHARPSEFTALLSHFERVLARSPPPRPEDYAFAGLGPRAHWVLYEQGCRSGAIVALERLIQTQAKSIRVLLVIGDDRVERVYHFDMVGGFPRSEADTLDEVCDDVVSRMSTTLSTIDIKKHTPMEDRLPRSLWDCLHTPPAMCAAGRELGKREFFSDMVRVADLMELPERVGHAFSNILSEQYSEGCFATWEPKIGALISTVTAMARPFAKDRLTPDDLSVIVGVRSDRMGALVREIEGRENAPPSSEAVELFDLDADLPRIPLPGGDESERVPVTRSKLHGHRGIVAFDGDRVEFVPLDPVFYRYPVSCGTEAHARAVRGAFARSEALRSPGDPRRAAFTVLPGHGVVMVEKWVEGKAPFQALWELMDAGAIQVEARVPQGPMRYQRDHQGRMNLVLE